MTDVQLFIDEQLVDMTASFCGTSDLIYKRSYDLS